MNCEKNYNHPLSRVRAYALYKRFCIFTVTSVTAPYVNIFVSTPCLRCDTFFNNKVFRVLYIRLTRQQKSRFFSSAFCKISPPFFSDFLFGCDTCDSKKTTSLLECALRVCARKFGSLLPSCFLTLTLRSAIPHRYLLILKTTNGKIK